MTPTAFPLALARKAAVLVVEALRPCCCKIAVAGSVRRQKEYVHDVDIVIWPKVETEEIAPALFGDGEKITRPVMLLRILNILDWYHTNTANPKIIHLSSVDKDGPYDKVPVELYLTEYDGSNYEALLQMRSGCAEFNESLAVRAKRMNLRYRAGYGVFDCLGARQDDGTEDGIFKALGIAPIPVERRIGDFHMCGQVRR